MDIMQIGTSLTIVVLAYVVGCIAKCFKKVNNDTIPVIVAVAGGILGAIGMYVIPEYPANDIMTAIAVGAVSGFASTGVDQAVKMFKKV